MSLDYGLGAVLALVLTGYLFYALVRPESSKTAKGIGT